MGIEYNFLKVFTDLLRYFLQYSVLADKNYLNALSTLVCYFPVILISAKPCPFYWASVWFKIQTT